MYVSLILLWLFFGLSHSVLAAPGVKLFFRQQLGQHFRWYRFAYSLFALFTLVFIFWVHCSLSGKKLWSNPWPVQWLAVAGGIAGLIIMVISAGKYFFYLSGIDVFFPDKQAEARLETGGLHTYVRHPLYFGTLLLVWSVFFLFPLDTNLVTASMITLYTITGTYFEERKLLKEYGNEYAQYRKSTPMLIPFGRKKQLGSRPVN